MQIKSEKGQNLIYVTVFPDDYDAKKRYPMVIMLHGFGANMHDLAPLGEYLNSTGYLYVCPNGTAQFDRGPGQVGFAWTPPHSVMDPAALADAGDLVSSFCEEVMEKHNVPPGRAVLLGFSQGGVLAYNCGLPQPERFAGVVSICSLVMDGEALTAKLPEKRTQPVFIAYGEQDTMLPAELSIATKEFLAGAGYEPFFKGYAMGHGINDEVIADLKAWLAQVLPPLKE